MKRLILLLGIVVLVFCVRSVFPQAAIEDSKGNKIGSPFPGGEVSVDITDNSIRIDNSVRFKNNWVLRIGISGKATNGIASILSTGKISPGGRLSLNVGYSFDAKKVINRVEEIHKGVINLFDGVWLPIKGKLNDIDEIRLEKPLKADKLRESLKALLNELQGVDKKLKSYSNLASMTKEEKIRLNAPIKVIKEISDQTQKLIQNLGDTESFAKNYTAIEKALMEDLKPKLSTYFSELTNCLIGKEIQPDAKLLDLDAYYEVSTYKLFSPDLPFENQIGKKTFNGAGLYLSYSHNLNSARTLIVVGAGIKRDNNADALDKVKINEGTTFTGSANGTGEMTRTITDEFTALNGTLETFTTKSVYISGFCKPFAKYPFRLAAYASYNVNRLKRPLVLGLGAFLVTEINSFKPIAGIVGEYEKDLKPGAEVIPFKKRFRINLMVSLPFRIPNLKF